MNKWRIELINCVQTLAGTVYINLYDFLSFFLFEEFKARNDSLSVVKIGL